MRTTIRTGIAWSALLLAVPAAAPARDVTPKLTLPAAKFCATPRPEMCTEDYDPVCGVDGDGHARTYGCLHRLRP